MLIFRFEEEICLSTVSGQFTLIFGGIMAINAVYIMNSLIRQEIESYILPVLTFSVLTDSEQKHLFHQPNGFRQKLKLYGEVFSSG